MSRGFTLIEMMICVAVIGIFAAAAGVTGADWRLRAQAELEREQALLALEYQAERIATGRAPDPATEARLAAPLRELTIARQDDGPTTTITVSWRDPIGATPQRALTVFRR